MIVETNTMTATQLIKPLSVETKEGLLFVGGCSVDALIKEHGSPLYVIDIQSLNQNCQNYLEPLQQNLDNYQIIYASKANLSIAMAKQLINQGLGFDVVSGGELNTVLRAGANPNSIYFHGNNKSKEELILAIKSGVRIVIDNDYEFELISQLSQDLKTKVSFLLRLKPEIEAHTHEFIKTGQLDSKFGLQKNDASHYILKSLNNPFLNFLGLHAHIGSQIFDHKPFEALVSRMLEEVLHIQKETKQPIKELNLGGGLGICYTKDDDPKPIKTMVNQLSLLYKKEAKRYGLDPIPKLILEPGRSISATAGLTLYKIGGLKHIEEIRDYAFIDGGMADNPRPILYQSEYTIELANKLDQPHNTPYTIAGKYCESGDILAKDILLPKVDIGDILVVYTTGAYNYSMASNYNRNPRPAMIAVENKISKTWIRRETLEDLLQYDIE